MRDYSGWKVEDQQRFKNMLSILDIAIRKISLPNMQITGMIQRTELHSIGIFLISMPQGLVIKDFSLLVE